MVRVVAHPLRCQDCRSSWDWSPQAQNENNISGDGPLSWSHRCYTEARYIILTCQPRMLVYSGYCSCAMRTVRRGCALIPACLWVLPAQRAPFPRCVHGQATFWVLFGSSIAIQGIPVTWMTSRMVSQCSLGNAPITPVEWCACDSRCTPSGPPCRARLDLVNSFTA